MLDDFQLAGAVFGSGGKPAHESMNPIVRMAYGVSTSDSSDGSVMVKLADQEPYEPVGGMEVLEDDPDHAPDFSTDPVEMPCTMAIASGKRVIVQITDGDPLVIGYAGAGDEMAATVAEAQAAAGDAQATAAEAGETAGAAQATAEAAAQDASDARTAAQAAESAATEADGKATEAQATAEAAAQSAAGAAKTATDYIDFGANGLVVGDMTASGLGKNVAIGADSVEIRDGDTALASFGAERIEIGKSSRNSEISFRDGSMTISNSHGNLTYTELGTNDNLLITSRNHIEDEKYANSEISMNYQAVGSRARYLETTVRARTQEQDMPLNEAYLSLSSNWYFTSEEQPEGEMQSLASLDADIIYIKNELYLPANFLECKPTDSLSLTTSFKQVTLKSMAQAPKDSAELMSVASNKVTCARDGAVKVTLNGFCSSIASRAFAQLTLFINGAQSGAYPLIDAFNPGASAYWGAFSGMGIVNVSAGDVLEIKAKTSSGTATLDAGSTRAVFEYVCLD